MPDFDAYGNPIIKGTPLKPFDLTNPASKVVPVPNVGNPFINDHETPPQGSGEGDIFKILGEVSRKSGGSKGVYVTNKELAENKRYDYYNPTIDEYEDFAAHGQSTLAKARNGILKGANLAATTVAGGFGMLGGLPYAAHTGRLADIWDNPFMRTLDKWNEKVDNEYLPNYYSNKEKNAAWYNTNNWATANFLFDKLVKNAGFAVGAMISGNIANAALGAAGAALGTGAAGLSAAAESSQVFKVFTPLLRNMARGFSAAKNIEMAAALENGITSIADIEAISGEMAAVTKSELLNIAKQANKFAKFNDVARRTAIAAYSSAGEASFEALQTAKEYRQNLIDAYKTANYGEAPSAEQMKAIEDEADQVGKISFAGNLALLGATEWMQLPKLMGSSYAAEKQAANSLLGAAEDVVLKEGKYVAAKAAPTTKFGKLYGGLAKGSKYVWDTKEMGQEIGQYALQVGVQNYFRKQHKTNDASLWTDAFLYGLFGKDETGEAKGALVSKEGLESGILGGLTGGLMQARGTYQQGKAVKSNTDRFIQTLNNAPSFKEAFLDKFGNINRGIALNEEQQQATIQGDQLEARDLKTDTMHNYVAPRIKYGRFDMVMEDMKEFREQAHMDGGLAKLKAQGYAGREDTVETFLKRISSIENYAKNTDELYKAANLRYAGETLKDEEGNDRLAPDGKTKLRKYSPLVIDKMVYAASKIADYDSRLPKVNADLTTYGIQTMEVLQSIIDGHEPNLQATEKALQDINNLNVISDTKDKLKIDLSDMIELSLRRQSFLQEYDDIKRNPLNYEEDQAYAVGEREELPVTVTQVEVPEGKKYKKAIGKPIEVGQEYSLKEPLRNDNGDLTLAPKMTVLSQTLGGEYEVRMPNGRIKFLTPSEFKEYTMTEEDNAFEGNEEMLHDSINAVLDKPRFAEEKAAITKGKFDGLNDKLFMIKMGGNKELARAIELEFNKRSAALIKEREERAAREELYRRKKEEWLNAQKNIVSKGADVPGVDTSGVNNSQEDPKKDESYLYKASTTESEGFEDPQNSRPHVTRSRIFLNSTNKFKNRGDMRVVLVHTGNAKSMGLEGIAELSYGGVLPADAANPKTGFLAQVYVVKDGNKYFYVSKDGKKLTEVGQKANLDEVVFQTMPTISLTWSNGSPRYRQDQKEDAEYQSKAYELYRQQLWDKGDVPSDPHPFWVSRGFPKVNPGPREHNQVGDHLVDESRIASHEGLITIPTTGTVTHNGRNLSYPNGVPVLMFGSTITFLNNRLVNEGEVKALYKAIEVVTSTVSKQIEKNQDIRPESDELSFIQGLLYWTERDTKKDNQIRIDDDMKLVIGDKKFALTEIKDKRAEIEEQLRKAWLTTNNKNLTKFFNDPFYEFYVDDKDELQSREWKNYQSYLLASKFPDGSNRTAEDTPLTTNVALPTEAVPWSFEQKYSVMEDVEFPTPATKKPTTPPPGPPAGGAPTATTPLVVDGFNIGPEHDNKMTTGLGDVEFIAELKNGKIEVGISGGAAIANIAGNRALDAEIKAVVTQGEGAEAYNKTLAGENPQEELAKKYLAYSLAAKLTASYQEQQKTPPPAGPINVGAAEALVREMLTPGGRTITQMSVEEQNLVNTVSAERKEAIKKEMEEAAKAPSKEQRIKNIKERIESLNQFLGNTDSNEAIKRTEKEIQELEKELAELEKAAPPTVVTADDLKRAKEGGAEGKRVVKKGDKRKFRKLGPDGRERMTDLDLELFKKWAEENVPLIPWQALDNLISTHDGQKAWGVFENGVAKFVKGGLRGTEYHEIGEAIWNGILTPEEQNALIDEFKDKTGTFLDRETGKKILYSEATDDQAKERILDDFSDYRLGKLPARTLGEKIRNFFKRIMDFFKSFVSKPSLKEELFKAIDTGKFRGAELRADSTSQEPQYKRVEGLSEEATHLMVEDMLARAAGILFSENDKSLLYSPKPIDSKELFEEVYQSYIDEADEYEDGTRSEVILDALPAGAWEALQVKVRDALRSRNINFLGEEDNINTENANKNDYIKEAFTPEGKSNSSRAVKFQVSTYIEREATNQENKASFTLPEPKFSSIGYKLLNFNKAYNTILNKVSNTTDIKHYIRKLVSLANTDANYVSHFQRIGGNLDTKDIPFNEFNFVDWRLFIDNWQVFTKQKPSAFIQYKILDEVYTGSANIFDEVKKDMDRTTENMRSIARAKTGLITYDKVTKTYKVNLAKLEEKDPTGKKIYDINNAVNQVAFLEALGIEFPMSTYKKLKTTKGRGKSSQQDVFAKTVSSLMTGIKRSPEIMALNGNMLDINGPLTTLAELKIKVTNPNQDPTYQGVGGKKVGSYTEHNVPSVFETEFNESNTLDELLAKRPELQDVFSGNSQVLKLGGLFFNEVGERIRDIKVEYIQGSKDIDENKGITTSKLGLGDRYTQEINQNLQGSYYILIPADGTTEWMMNLGNTIPFKDFGSKRVWPKIHTVFQRYLMDDIKLAQQANDRKKLVHVKNRATELRFFKDILSGNERYEKVLGTINEMITDNSPFEDIESYIYSDEAQEVLVDAVEEYINDMVNTTRRILVDNSKIVLRPGEDNYMYKDLDSKFAKDNNINKNKMSDEMLTNLLTFARVNYVINNIEYHKILFGDPYQFQEKKGKLDATKRIKSFLSPRRRTFDMPEFNTYLNENLNKAGDIELTENDPGYHLFDSYTKSVILSDHIIHGSLSAMNKVYGNTDESDGFSWLMANTYREIKIKNRQWSDQAEAFHQWQMAYTRKQLAAKGLYDYGKNTKLKEYDAELTSKPSPKHKIEVLKPIVTGNKYMGKDDTNKIDLMLHKTAQMPIYYSMVEGRTMENFYLKMMKEKMGYAIVQSGAKVGVEGTHNTYNSDGTFNTEPYNNTIKVPWKAYGIQVETTSEGEKTQTRGSQLTKMSSMDLFNNGVPIGKDAEAQKRIQNEYKHNMNLLDRMHENAYNELLNDMGVEDMGDKYEMKDGKAVSETLMREMMRRVVSDNVKDTIELNEDNQFRIPFEASPAYEQIRSILYSLIDKALISPKMHGGAHVQVPVTMFEDNRRGRRLAQRVLDSSGNLVSWKHISRAEYASLSDDEKKTVMMTDDTLKFYEDADGKRHCEVMIPHWFKNKFPKNKFPTDRSIIEYLNKSEEGKEILMGIGFRIPTQALSSVEVFKVKGFLPQYMGSTVVVPSEITSKAGSDFDIDKLNMYLKAIYVDANGDVRLVRPVGVEDTTKEHYGKVFDDVNKKKIEKLTNKADVKRMVDILRKIEDIEEEGFIDDDIIEQALEEDDFNFYEENRDAVAYIMDLAYEKEVDASAYLAKLTDKDIVEKLRSDFVKDMYKKSLENEYYSSLQRMLTFPEVFDRLMQPVDDAGLKDLSDKLNRLRGYDETKIKNRILDPNYMTRLRHSFAIGKKWVAVAASNITNLSLKQKSMVYINPETFDLLKKADKKYLGNGIIQLKHNKVEVEGYPRVSLSGTNVADSTEFISNRYSGYATAFVDVAKDPFIMDIIQSDLIIGTTMFLENIGTGEQGAMFLNQPIIAEYLKMLDGIGAKTLFNPTNLDAIRAKFGIGEEHMGQRDGVINTSQFEKNIETYYQRLPGIGTDEFKSEQANILDEMLKYAKMASYAFKFARATAYDTTRVTSGDHFVKKEWETEIAEERNIITSVNNVLGSTFLGRQKEILHNSMGAVGAVLKLEDRKLRAITDKLLKPYATKEFMTADNFNRIANKLKSSFLDFIIQSKGNFNSEIYDLVVNGNTALVNELERLKQKYPELEIIRDLTPITGERPDGAKTIALAVNVREAYDENRYTGMMRELRDLGEKIPELKAFYNNLIKISILQGTAPSPVSIKNIIPIEDYSAIVAPIMSQIMADPSLEIFPENFLFQKNATNDANIVPVVIPFFRRMQINVGGRWEEVPPIPDQYGNDIYQHRSTSFPNFKEKGINATDRRIMLLGDNFNSDAIEHDIIKVPRIVENRKTGDKVDMKNGRTMTQGEYNVRKAKGDFALKNFYVYQKVRYATGQPLIADHDDYEGDRYVYKLVNVYGDGNKATEYYPDTRMSVIDNGAAKIDAEMLDSEIVEMFGGELRPEEITTTYSTPEGVVRTNSIITRENVKANPNTLFLFGDNDTRKGLGGQAKEMRGEPNTIGISTKKYPSNDPSSFKSDNELEENKRIITQDINKAIAAGKSGKYNKIVVPPIGTGLANLPEKAPQTWEFLQQELNRLEKEFSPEERPEIGNILDKRGVPLAYTQGQEKALLDIQNLINQNKRAYYLLAGYAGTGKTTIAENIAKYAMAAGRGVGILAPTNKAAKVLNDKLKATGVASQPMTIHKAIYGEPNEQGEWIPQTAIKNAVLIVDEASMIDKTLMEDLIANTMQNNIIIFMGDGFQLEPVGTDAGLFTGKVSEIGNNKTELTEVKRQALDSNVLSVATLMRIDNKAYIPDKSIDDFTVTPSKNDFVNNFKASIKNNEDSVMIVATNAERIAMNKIARQTKFGATRTVVEPGEKLIAVANSTDFSNSETFDVENARDILEGPQTVKIKFGQLTAEYDIYVKEIDAKDSTGRVTTALTVVIPTLDKPSLYHPQLLEAIKANPTLKNVFDPYIITTKRGKQKLSPAIVISTYGYAITGHKSQGSQWEKAFINQNYVAPSWNGARWFYTAVTRAAQQVEVFPNATNTKLTEKEIDDKITNITNESQLPSNQLSYNPDYGVTEEEWNNLTDEERKTIDDQFNNCK